MGVRIKRCYIVNRETMDLALIDMPDHVSAEVASNIGYGALCLELHTNGVLIQDGIDAVLEVYPGAMFTVLSSNARDLAHNANSSEVCAFCGKWASSSRYVQSEEEVPICSLCFAARMHEKYDAVTYSVQLQPK